MRLIRHIPKGPREKMIPRTLESRVEEAVPVQKITLIEEFPFAIPRNTEKMLTQKIIVLHFAKIIVLVVETVREGPPVNTIETRSYSTEPVNRFLFPSSKTNHDLSFLIQIAFDVNDHKNVFSARRSILLDTQHPDGLEKIRELEAQGHPARLEVEEPPATPPRFVTELRVSLKNGFDKCYPCRLSPSIS